MDISEQRIKRVTVGLAGVNTKRWYKYWEGIYWEKSDCETSVRAGGRRRGEEGLGEWPKDDGENRWDDSSRWLGKAWLRIYMYVYMYVCTQSHRNTRAYRGRKQGTERVASPHD